MTINSFLNLFILSILLTSCSTIKRTAITSALGGALIGGVGGSVFSPKASDKAKNAFVFGALGSIIGVGLALLFNEKKTNTGLPPMILNDRSSEESRPKSEPHYEFNGVNLTPTIEIKPVTKYRIEDKALPDNLKGHVPARSLIEYYVPEKIINHKGKTIKIEAHKAFEVK